MATPYTRLLEINEALGAKIARSGSFFFAKCISYMYDEAVKFSWPCHLYQSRRQEAQEDGHGQNVRIEVKMSGLRFCRKCVSLTIRIIYATNVNNALCKCTCSLHYMNVHVHCS